MSDVEHRLKHSRRLANDERYIARQMKLVKRLAKRFGMENKRVGHRLHKLNAVTCGNSNCVMCGNPRKFFSEITIQEKLHMIEEKEFFKNQQEVVDNEKI